MPEFTVDIDLTQWNSFLKGLGLNLRATAPFLEAGANVFGFANIVRHFENEAGPDGAWPPRAQSTQQMYARLNKKNARYNPSNKLLQLTGRTKQSILPSTGKSRRLHLHAVELIAGTSYSGAINDGTRRMPARPFMWLDDKTLDDIGLFVLDSLMKENQ